MGGGGRGRKVDAQGPQGRPHITWRLGGRAARALPAIAQRFPPPSPMPLTPSSLCRCPRRAPPTSPCRRPPAGPVHPPAPPRPRPLPLLQPTADPALAPSPSSPASPSPPGAAAFVPWPSSLGALPHGKPPRAGRVAALAQDMRKGLQPGGFRVWAGDDLDWVPPALMLEVWRGIGGGAGGARGGYITLNPSWS